MKYSKEQLVVMELATLNYMQSLKRIGFSNLEIAAASSAIASKYFQLNGNPVDQQVTLFKSISEIVNVDKSK